MESEHCGCTLIVQGLAWPLPWGHGCAGTKQQTLEPHTVFSRMKATPRCTDREKWPATILTYYSEELMRKSGLLAHIDFYTVLPLTVLKQSTVAGTRQLALICPGNKNKGYFYLKVH